MVTDVWTVRDELTGDGLLHAVTHREGEAASVTASPISVNALSGASVRVELPDGFSVGPITSSSDYTAPGRLNVGWTAVTRGEGLWLFADLPVVLLDLVEMNGGKLAFYRSDAGPEQGTEFFTLWQGVLFDLVSGTFNSFDEASRFLADSVIAESLSGVTLHKPGWMPIDEELTLTVFAPDDSGRGDGILDIRSIGHSRSLFPWQGDEGQWGEFVLVSETIDQGFYFRSETAWANLVPGGVPSLPTLHLYEGDLLDAFNIVWSG